MRRGTIEMTSQRVALVVGNAGYAHAKKLKNALNDARGLGSRLKKLGFLIAGPAEARAEASFVAVDLDKAGMWQRFEAFLKTLKPGDVAFMFYAGHGLQVDDENYLVPIDARLDSASALTELVPLRQWIETVARKVGPQGTTLVFLDACREEPFAAEQMRRLAQGEDGASRGFHETKHGFATVRLKAGEGASPTFILFATAPGDFAYDGENAEHSPFSGALLRHIRTRGLSIDELFQRVGTDVQRHTEAHEVIQDPWRETNLKRNFYFRPGTWRPLLEMTGLALIAGVITCALLFDSAVMKTPANYPWLWAVGLLFGSVPAYGVLRWGSGRPLHAGIAIAASAVAFMVALGILQLTMRANVPKWDITKLEWTLDSIRNLQGLTNFVGNSELLAFTFLSLLAGIVLAVGTTLGLKPEQGVFRGFSAFTGALAVGIVLAFAAVAYVLITTWFAPLSREQLNAIMVAVGALWYGVLGFQLGYCFSYYVPAYRP